MRVICVEDERVLMTYTVNLCLELDLVDEAEGFLRASDAIQYMEKHRVDVALLDINMPDMSGMRLATLIQERWPETKIIFLTGYAQYAVDAFSIHVSGYLLKPVSRERLAAEIAHAAGDTGCRGKCRVEARTFGNFDLLVDGKPVAFRQAKCKELLAYLIDRQGASVKRREAFSVLWEDREYDRPRQKQFDVIVRSLRETLNDYGIGEILEHGGAALRVNPDLISCDAWRFFQGDPDAIQAFFGEYLSNYSWARITEGAMAGKNRNP